MDYEDEWRQVLGANLYKDIPNNLTTDSAMQSKINMHTSEARISTNEAKGITNLLFKDGQGHLHDSWMQGFYFDKKIKYGIYQAKGGPCGILATVQAYFLKHLLFGAKMSLPYLNQRNYSN